MQEKDELLNQLEQILHFKKSKRFYAERLGVTEEEINELYKEFRSKNQIEEKAKERITFFVDAPNLTDNDRIKLARIAKANSMPVEILIFDVEFNEAIERNKNRKRSVEVSKIEEQYSKFEKKSLLKFRLVNNTESVSFETLNVISSNNQTALTEIQSMS